MPTLVIKFLDTVNITGAIDGKFANVFADIVDKNPGYRDAAKLATTRTTYPTNYPKTEVEKVLAIIQSLGVQLRFLFSEITPGQLWAIMEQASNNLGQSKKTPIERNRAYTFANFFNYFKITDEAQKVESVWKALTPFVLVNPVDYGKCPLDCVYWRKPTMLATGLDCGAAHTDRQEFWETMAIADFWSRQINRNIAVKPPQASNAVIIHDIEYAWAASNAFPDWVHVDNRPDESGALHGCAVLGLLVAKWPTVSGPIRVRPDTVRGIAPFVGVETYSAVTADDFRVDDALAKAMYKARKRAGDVILLEIDLEGMPEYDLDTHFKIDGEEIDLFKRRLPLEFDQAIFELIEVATKALGLLVVEPAGNGALEFEKLRNGLSEKDSERRVQLYRYLPEIHKDVLKYLQDRIIRPTARYVAYDTVKDSGAIMVGASVNKEGNWQRHIKTNYGNRVDVYAPGESILTSYPGQDSRGIICQTSAATAIIAGMVAALQSIQKQKHPGRLLTSLQVRLALRTFLFNEYNPLKMTDLNDRIIP